MMQGWKNLRCLVLGLGETGWSCVRFFAHHGVQVSVVDTRHNPPHLQELQQRYPNVPYLGTDVLAALHTNDLLVVSPGLALAPEWLDYASQRGLPILSDLEVLARSTDLPVIAITGTNGKSTVTTLVAAMLRAGGMKVAAGGNLGPPALELLLPQTPHDPPPQPEVLVLEVSSYQLEHTYSLKPWVACCLNVAHDHLDRHGSWANYHAAKQRVYHNAHHAVFCRDDPATQPTQAHAPGGQLCFGFGQGVPEIGEVGVRTLGGMPFVACGQDVFFPLKALPHDTPIVRDNVLAACAIVLASGWMVPEMWGPLHNHSGLPHRCHNLGTFGGITYINDSKGTNPHAAEAALRVAKTHASGEVLILLGGDGKGVDCSSLLPELRDRVRGAFLFGRDAALLEHTIASVVPTYRHTTLDQALASAQQHAQTGDVILLSPACSSLDQFKNYAHRGEHFMHLVHEHARNR